MDLEKVSQEEFEKIEAYINGELSKDAALEFETKLNTDIEFNAKFRDIKTVLTGIEAQAMKEQLDVFHNELSDKHTETIVHQPKVRFLNWKRIAAAAAIIIGLGSFWWFSGNSNDRLYAEYFTPDPGLPTTMSTTNNYDFYEAMVDYKRGHYDTAIKKWTALQKTKPQNDTLNYFVGSAYMANKNEEKAIPYLENTIEQESVFKDDAYYYLGLAYLKSNNIELAKKYLYLSTYENSKDILSKLKE